MAKQGRLNLQKCGYSMPADAPAYQKPPFYFREVRAISVAYETDTEAALALLPEPLALPEPAIAALTFCQYRWSTVGPYNEAILSLMVEHKGRPLAYIARIAVTTEPPMLAGREIYGYSKRLAAIEFKLEGDIIYATIARPADVRIASAMVRPERPASADVLSGNAVTFRLIPSPEENAERPTCAELIESNFEQRLIEAWTGNGSVAFAEGSMLDPWNALPVKKVVSAGYTVYDMTLGWGKVIDRLR